MKNYLSLQDVAGARKFGHFRKMKPEPKRDSDWMFVLFVVVSLTLFFVL